MQVNYCGINITVKSKGLNRPWTQISRVDDSLECGSSVCVICRGSLVVVLEAPGVHWFRHSHCTHVSGVENKLGKLQHQNTRLHHWDGTNSTLGQGGASTAQLQKKLGGSAQPQK